MAEPLFKILIDQINLSLMLRKIRVSYHRVLSTQGPVTDPLPVSRSGFLSQSSLTGTVRSCILPIGRRDATGRHRSIAWSFGVLSMGWKLLETVGPHSHGLFPVGYLN